MHNKKIHANKLSADIGISTGAISAYKNGKGLPGTNELLKLASELKVSTAYLFGETSDTKGREDFIKVEKRLGLSAQVQETLEKMTIISKRGNDVNQKSFYSDMIKLINWLILTTNYDNNKRSHQKYNPILPLILFYLNFNTNIQYDLFATGEIKDYTAIQEIGYSPNALILDKDLMGDAVLTHLTRAIVEMKNLHYSNKEAVEPSDLAKSIRSKRGGNVNVKEEK